VSVSILALRHNPYRVRRRNFDIYVSYGFRRELLESLDELRIRAIAGAEKAEGLARAVNLLAHGKQSCIFVFLYRPLISF
jgi:hypothetical protein